MGCDIHMYIERKTKKGWQRVSEAKGVQHPYYVEPTEPQGPDDNAKAKVDFFEKKTWWPGRNYALFGLLAGVRSKVFFPFIPPRDIPSDVSPGVKKIYERDGRSVHTPSYLTLSELISFQDTVEDVPCWLDVSQFKKYKKTGEVPEDFWDVLPKGPKSISNDEMTRIMNLSAFLDEREYFTCVVKKTPVKEISKTFWVDIVDAMKKLSKDPNNVRCVFWFDN
jgi:hypothetical protein